MRLASRQAGIKVSREEGIKGDIKGDHHGWVIDLLCGRYRLLYRLLINTRRMQNEMKQLLLPLNHV